MAKREKSKVGSKITSHLLTEQDYSSIGKIIRYSASIDTMIDLYLARLARLSPGALSLLLGRTPPQVRLQIAGQIAKANGPEFVKLHDAVFKNEDYLSMVSARHTLAHGQLLGLTDRSEIAFAVNQIAEVNESSVRTKVFAYTSGSLAGYAKLAEKLAQSICEALDLTESLKLIEPENIDAAAAHLKSPTH